ncbi:MAG: hypothetical protein WAU86_14700 [Oricola sp.]
MRIPVIMPIAIALVVGPVWTACPAQATTFSQAVDFCRKSGACVLSKNDKAGGWNIKYGRNEIFCPDEGDCVCLACGAPPPKRTESGTVIRDHRNDAASGGVRSLKRMPSPLGAGEPARPLVRDHRR